MRLHKFINEGNDFTSIIKNLSSMTYRKAEQFLRDQFEKFTESIPSEDIEKGVLNIINKSFDTRYRSLQEIMREKVPALRESNINEDVEHWWQLVKTEAFPTLSFYPALTAWLEIDKFLRGQDINIRVLVVYSTLWLLLISGKYIKGWMEWKKQNPEEFSMERMHVKGGII